MNIRGIECWGADQDDQVCLNGSHRFIRTDRFPSAGGGIRWRALGMKLSVVARSRLLNRLLAVQHCNVKHAVLIQAPKRAGLQCEHAFSRGVQRGVSSSILLKRVSSKACLQDEVSVCQSQLLESYFSGCAFTLLCPSSRKAPTSSRCAPQTLLRINNDTLAPFAMLVSHYSKIPLS